VVAQVLVHHRCPHVGDLRALGQPVDDERIERGVVCHGDVDEEVLDAVAASGPADLDYYAVSVIGPRNRVDKLVKGLPLLN
jgi:hypothetical protein